MKTYLKPVMLFARASLWDVQKQQQESRVKAMDANYFGLSENPFAISPVPEVFFQSSNWLEVSQQLTEDILNSHGIILLTGKSGVGKTLLLRDLANRLRSQVTFAHPKLIGSDLNDFAGNLLAEFGLEYLGESFLQRVDRLNEYLTTAKENGSPPVVILDDADSLDQSELKNILLFGSPASDESTILKFLLCGLPEVEVKLRRIDPAHSEKYASNHHRLECLKSYQVVPYIKQRLNAVGYTNDDLFTAEAVSRIAEFSDGAPGSINRICRLAVEAACAAKKSRIDAETIQAIGADLGAGPDMTLDSGDTMDNEESIPSKKSLRIRFSFKYKNPKNRASAGSAVIETADAKVTEGTPLSIRSRLGYRAEKSMVWAIAGFILVSAALLLYGAYPPDAGIPEQTTNSIGEQSQAASIFAGSNSAQQPRELSTGYSDATGKNPLAHRNLSEPVNFQGEGIEGTQARLFIEKLESVGEDFDFDNIYEQAEAFSKNGQSADAYILYFYAAKHGHGISAFKLAQLLDPATFNADLSMIEKPNLILANNWYRRAARAGHPKIEYFLERLHAAIEKQAGLGDELAESMMLQLK